MLDTTQKRVLTILVIVALAFGAYFLWGYFNLIATAVIVALLFNPIYHFYLKKFKRPGTASALTIVTAFFTLVIPLTIILALTVQQAAAIVKDVETIVANSGSVQEAVKGIVDQINNTAARIPGVVR